jgi:hypothetical protein
MDTENLAKKFNVIDTKSRSYKLRAFFSNYIGRDVQAHEYIDFVRQVSELMPAGVRRKALHDSLVCFHGRPVTNDLVVDMSWRLAGNIDLLREGVPVTTDVALTRKGWCAVQIVKVTPTVINRHTRNKQRGSNLTLFVLTGHAAGVTINRFRSMGQMYSLSRLMGFSAPHKQLPYRDERELFGLRFGALMDPSCVSKEGTIWYSDSCCEGTMLSRNKQILSRRNRIDFACPLGKDAESFPCFRCWKGTESCSASVHLKDYEEDYCEYCKQDSLFDPDTIHPIHNMCVNCNRLFEITGVDPNKRKADNEARIPLN